MPTFCRRGCRKVRMLLGLYLDQRIQFYINEDDIRREQIRQRTSQLQADLWAAVRGPATDQPTPVAALVLAGMNNVINSQGYTQAAFWNRIPNAAWLLMAAIALCANVLFGYRSRKGPGTRIVLPFVISIAWLLIADIDAPRHGLIRISRQNLRVWRGRWGADSSRGKCGILPRRRCCDEIASAPHAPQPSQGPRRRPHQRRSRRRRLQLQPAPPLVPELLRVLLWILCAASQPHLRERCWETFFTNDNSEVEIRRGQAQAELPSGLSSSRRCQCCRWCRSEGSCPHHLPCTRHRAGGHGAAECEVDQHHHHPS